MRSTLAYDQILSRQAHTYAAKEYCRSIGLTSRVDENGEVICYPDNANRCVINNSPPAPFRDQVEARNMKIATQYCSSIGQQPYKISDENYACSDSRLRITPIDLNYAQGVNLYSTGASLVMDGSYREWTKDISSGKNVCVKTLPAIRDYCHTFKDRRGNQTIGYFQGNLTCNLTGGYCKAISEEDGNIPSCTITPDYCDAYSANYASSPNGAGHCYLPGGQKFAESAVGTTIVRVYRDNIDQAIRACGSNDGAKCFVSTMQVLVAPAYILSDFMKEEYEATMKNINEAVDRLYNDPSPANLANLGKVAFDSLPPVYWGKKIFGTVAGLLDGLVGMIPGLNKIVPGGFFSKMVEYGFTVMNPFFWIQGAITWGPKIWDYIVNFDLDDLKDLVKAVAKFGADVLNVVNKLWQISSGVWLIKKILPSFISGPVIFLLNILTMPALAVLNDLVKGKNGYIYKLFSGDFNANIRNFFTNQVGQTFFRDWIYGTVLKGIWNGLQDAYSWFMGLWS